MGISDQPIGTPIIQATNDGRRRPLPVPDVSAGSNDSSELVSGAGAEPERVGESSPLTTTSVSVAPELRPLSFVQFPATPDAFASVAVGDGRSPRSASLPISVGSCPRLPVPLWSRATGIGSRLPCGSAAPTISFSVRPERELFLAPTWRALEASGVGRSPMFAASTSVGPSLPERVGIERDPFVASEARGVGIIALASAASRRPPFVPFRSPSGFARLHSLACGVGSSLAASASRVDLVPSPRSPPVAFGPQFESEARGVGSILAASSSEVGPLTWLELVFGACGFVVGVGSLMLDAAVRRVSPRSPGVWLRPWIWFSGLVVGVGSNFAAPLNVRLPRMYVSPPLPPASLAIGVGSIPVRAIADKLGVPALGRSFAPPLPLIPFWLEPYSDAVGVGSEQEEAIAEVRGADGGSGNTVPRESPPARAHVPEDLRECSASVNRKEARDVFEEEGFRAGFLDDPPEDGPEPSLVFDAFPAPGDRGPLAWDPAGDEVDVTSPRSTVERFEVVPDRRFIECSFLHA